MEHGAGRGSMEDSAEGNSNCGSLAQEIPEGLLVSGRFLPCKILLQGELLQFGLMALVGEI